MIGVDAAGIKGRLLSWYSLPDGGRDVDAQGRVLGWRGGVVDGICDGRTGAVVGSVGAVVSDCHELVAAVHYGAAVPG